MKRMLCGGVLALSALFIRAEDAAAKKEVVSPAPAVVNPEVAKFLTQKMTLGFADVVPADALEMQMSLLGAGLKIACTAQAGKKTLTITLTDVSGAEALRVMSEKTGLGYRFAGNTLRLATADEWKEIDAGKKTFEELAK